MCYHFINKYCELAIEPEPGIQMHLHGWITYANPNMLLLTDEEGDEIPIDRNDLSGSIVVMEEQQDLRITKGEEVNKVIGFQN